jgi:hypothetical protein
LTVFDRRQPVASLKSTGGNAVPNGHSGFVLAAQAAESTANGYSTRFAARHASVRDLLLMTLIGQPQSLCRGSQIRTEQPLADVFGQIDTYQKQDPPLMRSRPSCEGVCQLGTLMRRATESTQQCAHKLHDTYPLLRVENLLQLRRYGPTSLLHSGNSSCWITSRRCGTNSR